MSDQHLDPIRSGQRVELQSVLADGELLLVSGPGDGAVDVGELAPGILLPLPNIRRSVRTCKGGNKHHGKVRQQQQCTKEQEEYCF